MTSNSVQPSRTPFTRSGMSLALWCAVSTMEPLVKRNRSATVKRVTAISKERRQGSHPYDATGSRWIFSGSVCGVYFAG